MENKNFIKGLNGEIILAVGGVGVLTYLLYNQIKNKAGTENLPVDTSGEVSSYTTNYFLSDLFGSGQQTQPTQNLNPFSNTNTQNTPDANQTGMNNFSNVVASVPSSPLASTTFGRQLIQNSTGNRTPVAQPQNMSIAPSVILDKLTGGQSSSNPFK